MLALQMNLVTDLINPFLSTPISSRIQQALPLLDLSKIQLLFNEMITRPVPVPAPLYSRKEIIASNVESNIGKARIIYLLQTHKNCTDARLFNEKIIRNHYKRGDVILVESDSSAKPEKEDLDCVRGLELSKYKIRGWDAPGPVSIAKKEGRGWTREEKIAFIRSTWQERQEALQQATLDAFSYFGNNHVFVVMGPDHGFNKDPGLTTQAIDFLPKLGYSFVIVDPRALSIYRP